MRALDKNDVPGAVHHLWRAVEMSPENAGYSLELASLLSDMQRYGESNEILLLLMQCGDAPGECFFGLGRNFLGLGDMDSAFESLDLYMRREPDGDFADDAAEMLDRIGDQRRDGRQPEAAASPEDAMRLRAKEGSRLLQAGEFKKAAEALRDVKLPGEDGLAAGNDLAAAYYYDGRPGEAIRVLRGILREHPGHLHSQCNLALFLYPGEPAQARCVIAKAAKAAGNDPVMNYRVGVVLCEMGEHAKARRAMEPIAARYPFDVRIQHYYALCCYNSGQIAKAASLWEKLRRLCPDNPAIGWYAGLAAARLRNEAGLPETLGYSINVPPDEAIRRIRAIGSRVQESRSLRSLGRDREFREMLVWGMTLRDIRIRRAMLQLMVASGGRDNERALRRMLVSRSETDEFKHEIFLGLKAMNASQPYLALMDGSVVEVCVRVRKAGIGSITDSSRMVADLLDRRMTGPIRKHLEEARTLWNKYLIARFCQGKPLRARKFAAWAAAVHGCVARRHGMDVPCGELAGTYGAGAGAIGSCMRRILGQTGNKEGGEDGLPTR